MDEIRERIKEYVLIINPELKDDAYLDFIVADAVDRALIYTNRMQLVDGYERFLNEEYFTGNCIRNRDGEYEPVLPIPTELERPLATIVNGVYRTVQENLTATQGAVTQVTDNGQSISYGNELASFIPSKSDAEIFSGTEELLAKFRIPTIVETT